MKLHGSFEMVILLFDKLHCLIHHDDLQLAWNFDCSFELLREQLVQFLFLVFEQYLLDKAIIQQEIYLRAAIQFLFLLLDEFSCEFPLDDSAVLDRDPFCSLGLLWLVSFIVVLILLFCVTSAMSFNL